MAGWWRREGPTALLVVLLVVLPAPAPVLAFGNPLPVPGETEGLFECPSTTYKSLSLDESLSPFRQAHCVCPATFICEGCQEGCVTEKSLRRRCVRGFRPSCPLCRCEPGPGRGATMLGQLVDRRREPFCPPPAEGTAEGRPAVYEGPLQFAFIVSNGHTGTTLFGQQSRWRAMFGKHLEPGWLIHHEQDGNRSRLRGVPMWEDHCARGREYVAKDKLPTMRRDLEPYGHTHFLGSGHQVILGILPALADTLRDAVRLVRLRRNRLDVAYSYARKGAGPCSHHCVICLCPLDPLARCPVSGEVWGTLSVFQRYLWFVDEVECQWQALLHSRPWLAPLSNEVNWGKTIGVTEMMSVGAFIGLVSPGTPPLHAEAEKANPHVNSSDTRNATWVREQDLDYRRKLGLTRCNDYHCVPPLDE